MPDMSFYGGKSGFSFVIVKSFSSVAEMVAEFKKGPGYTVVHYDEHVLINTDNKSNQDNGKLYRRGYNYSNDMGGAIYIGSIVGPAGKAPDLKLATVEQVKALYNKEGFADRYAEGEYSVPMSLLPGKTDDGRYNDSIQWASYCIRNEDETESTAYLGFAFPYTVIDFTAESITPYYGTTSLINRTDGKNHPFYEKWNIKIPKGIKGDAFKNFRVIPASNIVQDYVGKDEDVRKNREIFVYDYINYDNSASGESATLYLGDYNVIDDLSIDEHGTVKIEYSHDDDDEYNQLIKWIKEVTLEDNGHFTVEYNQVDINGNPIKYETNLKWITGITVGDDGTLHIDFNNGQTEEYNGTVKGLKNVTIQTKSEEDGSKEGSGDQRIHIEYNTGLKEAIGEPLNYIMATALTDDYHLLIYYSDPARRAACVANGVNYTFDGKDDWYDLGIIKSENGILVGLNINVHTENAELVNQDAAIAYLNGLYPSGLQGVDLKGKVVSIGEPTKNKDIYAFDYVAREWFYLGKIGGGGVDNVAIIAGTADDGIEDKKEELSIGGLWFILGD